VGNDQRHEDREKNLGLHARLQPVILVVTCTNASSRYGKNANPHGMYTLTVWKVFDLCGEENEADKQRQKCLSD
jgi:hypothetical protein